MFNLFKLMISALQKVDCSLCITNTTIQPYNYMYSYDNKNIEMTKQTTF